MKGMRKIKRGAGFRGAAEYLSEEGKAQIIGGNMSGQNPRDLAREFGVARALRPDIGKPVWHNSLRVPKGEIASEYQWQKLADEYMQRMGFTDLHQRAYWLEDHPDGQHVHILANRIALDGSIYYGKNENLESTKIIHELEKKHGFQITAYRDELNPTTPKKDRVPTKNEIAKGHREQLQPPRMCIQHIISEAMKDRPSTAVFLERIEAAGVIARPNLASTGRMNGFSYEFDGIAFKGSELGSKYAWKSIQRSIDYEQNRDIKVLAERARLLAADGGNRSADLAHGHDYERLLRDARSALSDDGHAPGRDSQATGRVDTVSAIADGVDGSNVRAADENRGDNGENRVNNGEDARPSAGLAGSRQEQERIDREHDGRTAGSKIDSSIVVSSERGLNGLSDPVLLRHEARSNADAVDIRGARPTVAPHIAVQLQAWQQQSRFLGAEWFEIKAIDRAPRQDSDGKMRDKTHKVDVGVDAAGEKITRLNHDHVSDLIARGRLSALNARSYDIYITAHSPRFHYILVDDLKGRAGIDALMRAGYKPAIVQETSKDNFQAVLRVPKLNDGAEERLAANALAQALNRQYGDPHVHASIQPFRLAGFANKKPTRGSEFTTLDGVLSRPVVCDQATRDLAAARVQIARNGDDEMRAVRSIESAGRAYSQAIQLANDKDISRFREAAHKHAVVMSNDKRRVDNSLVDFCVAKDLLREGWAPERVAAVLTVESRHRLTDDADYARCTVERAASDLRPRPRPRETPKLTVPSPNAPKVGR